MIKGKLICWVGINDADYPVCSTINGKKAHSPFYRVWRDMLERCYSPADEHPLQGMFA